VTKKEIQAAFYKRHRQRLLRECATYRRKNRTRIREKQRRHNRENPEKRLGWRDKVASLPANRLVYLYKKATKRGWEYDIRLKYVLMANPPDRCACCQKRLIYRIGRGVGRYNSPSLDRKNNNVGYTIGNTHVVCFRCNRIKADATPNELRTIIRYMEAR
jgi:hypothetical protein